MGMNPVLSTHEPAFFVSSRLRVSKNNVSFGDPVIQEAGNGSRGDTKEPGSWVLKRGFMPIHYDGVLAGSQP